MESESIKYHLSELKLALEAPENGRNHPILYPNDKRVLDIGCGIGQTFMAWTARGYKWTPRNGRTWFVGIDPDQEAISYGIKNHSADFTYLLNKAEALPFPTETFDLVFSRVSLPYTNVPVALREIRRVLKTGGRVWMTLHAKDRPGRMLKDMVGVRSKIYRCIEWLNGHCLQKFGFLVPIQGRYISWQDTDWMIHQLDSLGIKCQATIIDDVTIIEGTLKA